MEKIKKHFQIGSEEWKVTVKNCLRIGVGVGLFVGVVVLLEIL